jgi:hypothetical protein
MLKNDVFLRRKIWSVCESTWRPNQDGGKWEKAIYKQANI